MKIACITRCLNEPYISEFCEYYLSQGVDHIFVVDDCSHPDTYLGLHQDAIVVRDLDFRNGLELDDQYQRIRHAFDWVIVVDADEFIGSRDQTTIRDYIEACQADCVMIPWVMMAFGGRLKNPPRLIESTTWRWTHDLHHRGRGYKFRDRFDRIEVKCAFRTQKWLHTDKHTPSAPIDNPLVIESIDGKPYALSIFYTRLGEDEITRSGLCCYHYRVVSIEHAREKLRNNSLSGYKHAC